MGKYKPTKRTSEYSDSELLEKLRETARKLNKNILTMDEFEANSDLSRGPYKRKWGWNIALKMAGLIPSKEKNVDNEQILSDMKRVFDLLGRIPTKAEYNEKGIFSTALIQRRFKGLIKAYNKLDNYITDKGEDALMPIAAIKPTQKGKPLSKSKNKLVGEIINFRDMLHGPWNEMGVILLFGVVYKELGFIIDSISQGFPDCNAKRKIDGAEKYKPVSIEFEFKSKNFLKDKHNPEECDIIVCWEHNWSKCPEDIEVIELKKEIKKLPPG